MRRSAAPSQLGSAAKRPRFNPPVLGDTTRNARDVLKLIQDPPKERSTPARESEEKSRPALQQDVINDEPGTELAESNREENLPPFDQHQHDAVKDPEKLEKPSFKPVFKSFKAPVLSQNAATNKCPGTFKSPVSSSGSSQQPKSNTGTPDSDDGPKPNYFNVMWCKLSKKKHKKWEGDAILVTKGRTVSLLDTDGKEIGRGSGYKTTELQTLAEGHTLAIGGKEIEVMSLLSEEDFRSGKCFTSGGGVAASEEPKSMKTMNSGFSKPFSKPLKAGQQLPVQAPTVVKPRHDPEAPEALVMPRPGLSHQFDHNKSQLQLVDVVVDPYICQHLRPHQRAGVVFLYECIMGMKNFTGQGAILADEMGLGKTLQCISLIWTLLKQGPYGGKPVVKKVLVVTPGSLVKNWLREFKKWLGTERLKVFAVTPDNKVSDFVDSPIYPVLIVSYEMFVRTIDTVRSVNFDLIICDEGHRLKNTNIKTTTLVSSLSSRRRIVLTGTPVQNDLQELYSIVDFCNPGVLGTSSAFRHVYEDAIVASRRPGATSEDRALGQTRAAELNRTTALFILRRTSDINNMYLPPKVEVVMFCRPAPLQRSVYARLLASRVVRSCLASRDTAQHLMCISALRKLCNHPSLLYDKARQAGGVGGTEWGVETEEDLYSGLLSAFPADYDPASVSALTRHGGKLSVLSELLAAFYSDAPRQRVVLVSNYTQTLDTLERLCTARGYQSLRLDGQTPTSKRQQLVERFNSQYSNDFVFLLSSKAGGIGLNLVGASRLILYDIDWNPANDLQAMARVWRDGQRHTTYIYRLLTTGTIEEKMYQRQVSKQALSGVVVDAKAQHTNQVQFSPEDLRDLFILREDTDSSTHDTLGCPCQQGSQQGQTEVTEVKSDRVCQLGRPKSGGKKNLCMDELFQWQHLRGPNPQIDIDPLLSEADLHEVSFVFCCQSNTTSANVVDAD